MEGMVFVRLYFFLVIAATFVLLLGVQRWASSENRLRRFIDRYGVGKVGVWLAFGTIVAIGTYLTLVYS